VGSLKFRTRTRTNTNPNGTEANAAGRSVRACDARKSKIVKRKCVEVREGSKELSALSKVKTVNGLIRNQT